MGFRPMVKIDSTLIHFKTGVNKTYESLVENIENVLKGNVSVVPLQSVFDSLQFDNL